MRILNNEKYKVDIIKLQEYGFIKESDTFIYNKNIMNNEFNVVVENKNGIMTSKLIEKSFNDEYLQADSTTTGEFSNTIKNSYDEVIEDVKDKCLKKDIFKSDQAIELIKYIKQKYNCDLEYLWEKSDDNAIVRNSINNKWFGIFMKVSKSKFHFNSDDLVEILDLTYYKEKIDDIVDCSSIFPGYHMNKKSWISILLDNSMKTEDIINLIDISYEISIKRMK